mmetsp:Transcript_18213/g.45972  ORF Transcript_18213/g.45972 Transcript_18213/m.45972 type:complete len:367 (-) Transcript_18213:101-1201(-)
MKRRDRLTTSMRLQWSSRRWHVSWGEVPCGRMSATLIPAGKPVGPARRPAKRRSRSAMACFCSAVISTEASECILSRSWNSDMCRRGCGLSASASPCASSSSRLRWSAELLLKAARALEDLSEPWLRVLGTMGGHRTWKGTLGRSCDVTLDAPSASWGGGGEARSSASVSTVSVRIRLEVLALGLPPDVMCMWPFSSHSTTSCTKPGSIHLGHAVAVTPGPHRCRGLPLADHILALPSPPTEAMSRDLGEHMIPTTARQCPWKRRTRPKTGSLPWRLTFHIWRAPELSPMKTRVPVALEAMHEAASGTCPSDSDDAGVFSSMFPGAGSSGKTSGSTVAKRSLSPQRLMACTWPLATPTSRQSCAAR